MKERKGFNWKRSLLWGLMIVAGVIIYAYGFEVTDVSLEEMEEPRRQANFQRILRALAHPDIFEYEQEEVIISHPIYIDCPTGELNLPEPDTTGPYIQIDPPCAAPRTDVTIEGFNFAPNMRGPINLIPPSGVTLQLGNFQTDEEGNFSSTVTLPNRKPVPEPQEVRTITRHNVGLPRLSRNGLETWYKIIETVFLALLATTFGTLLAIPVSFLAARNIMKDVKVPVAGIALSLLAWPTGMIVGGLLARWASGISEQLTDNTVLAAASIIATPIVLFGAVRYALPQEERRIPAASIRMLRFAVLVVAGAISVLGLFLLAYLADIAGTWLEGRLAAFDFLGTFVASLGDILGALITVIVALSVGAIVSGWAGKLGQLMTERIEAPTLKFVNILLSAIAGAALAIIIGLVIDWFYSIGNPLFVWILPAIVGAVLGATVALRYDAKESLPIGLNIYYAVRTVLNALRSIEAFIMAIIFVVLVSTGPFAGVLALTLHTVAALAKLYSEQVESILPGPLEAIRATGANRLQTIVYAVIPQIIPPYISFTMYRWDINVRMSTIIGFAGGGGIGFLLQQNINLLNYRAAAAQMLAITIVVALMDYISSALRERVV